MRHLPTGTVTFLFTDVEGSTRILLEDDERYGTLLGRQRRALREVFGRYGGLEMDTQGDAFFYVFSSAREAVKGAQEAQSAVAAILPTRIGLHTGEARLTDEGYVGLDVHRSARIAAAAHGGQVLLSQSTRELVDAEVVDLGSHHLKDLAEPERLYQLGAGEYPPLPTLFQSNLPLPPTPLVGRAREIEEIQVLIGDRSVRLVTLTGAGGSGKTRLAIASAQALADQFIDGVWWVPLAGLRDCHLVVPTIGSVLGTPTLAASIGSGERLLVLDNMEQVASAATEIAPLLQSCPGLKVLVTSRMRLAVATEREYVVSPMVRTDAAELFRARAPGDSSGPVDDVCSRLDDLPLAIELVAARTKTMSVAEILNRLDPRIPLLTGGPRDAPDRQKTLRATLDWAYDLLDGPEREAFARLSVFAGGCTMEAADEVCRVGADLVGALVDKSLLTLRDDRLRMLETTREYGLELLHRAGEVDDLNRRLGHYLADIGERASRARGHAREYWHLRMMGELDNLRSVTEWAIAHDPGLALRLVGNADEFGTPPAELREWITQSLAYDGPADPLVRAKAFHAAAHVASAYHFDLDPTELKQAEKLLAQSLAIYRSVGEREREARITTALAQLASLQGSHERACSLFDESLSLFRALDDLTGQFHALNLLGELERDRGDLPAAKTQLTRALNVARQADDGDLLAMVTHGLGDVARDEHDLDGAEALYEEALRTSPMTRSGRWTACYCLAGLAAVAGTRNDAATAGRRWGAYEALERANGLPLPPRYRSTYQLALKDLEPTAFHSGVLEGASGSTDANRTIV
jgi:predicted ATPase